MKKAIVVSCLTSLVLSASAKIEIGTPFSDGAVLQRGMKVPVWGKVVPDAEGLVPPAEGGPKIVLPGKRKITVSFAGQEKAALADPVTGVWKVELDPMEASKESRTMTVVEETGVWFVDLFSSPADTVEIKDVLVGEVWFASGQSNMDCPIVGGNTRYRDMNGTLVTEMTNLKFVRYVKNQHVWSVGPKPIKATWRAMTAENLRAAGYFSAVAYYYARELYLALDLPIGIVDSSWGGTNIDAWTPRCGYEGIESLKDVAALPILDAKAFAESRKDGVYKKTYGHGQPHQQPTALWNGMVASWAPMAMRGFIWYQGCHNSGEHQLYCAKMHALYDGWSREFANPSLKLYFVQLAPWRSNWNGLVAAQNKFVAEEKNAALAVTADVGNFDDIHPNQKEIVAKRLAVHALKRDYGFDIAEDCSPVCRSATFAGGKVSVDFDHVKGWYVYAQNYSRAAAFEVAGTNGVWTAAKIVNFRQQKGKDGKMNDTDFIDGSKIVVAADGVADPVRVRYMGQARTAGTMYNQANLPLGPFEASK